MRPTYLIHARGRRLSVLLAVLVAALLLQACARDAATDSSTESASAPVEQESDVPVAAGSEPAAASEAAPEDDSDEAAGGGEVAGIDLSGDFCSISNQLDESDIFDEPPTDADEFAETGRKIKRIYAALDEKAPQEIADDVDLLTRIGSDQIDLATRLTANADEDPTEVLNDPEVAEQMAQFDEDGQYTQAAERLDRWTERNC